MEHFVVRPMTWPVFRIFSRNPLMRPIDRVEAAIGPIAMLLVIVAAACAGALGTIVHETRQHQYATESATRHTVQATALSNSSPGASPGSPAFSVQAHWRIRGVDHTEHVASDFPVKAADTLTMWVNANGNRVEAPTPVARAAKDAMVIAFLAWWFAAFAINQIADVALARIAQSRDTLWERDIRDLIGDENGRTNHS